MSPAVFEESGFDDNSAGRTLPKEDCRFDYKTANMSGYAENSMRLADNNYLVVHQGDSKPGDPIPGVPNDGVLMQSRTIRVTLITENDQLRITTSDVESLVALRVPLRLNKSECCGHFSHQGCGGPKCRVGRISIQHGRKYRGNTICWTRTYLMLLFVKNAVGSMSES